VSLVLASLIGLAVGALLLVVFPRAHLGFWLALGSSVLGFLGAAKSLASGEVVELSWAWTVPYGSLHLRLDPLAAWFLLLLFALVFATVIYGRAYWKDLPSGKLSAAWGFFCCLVLGMAVVLLAANAVLFLVSWEAMSLAAFFLVTLDSSENGFRAGWIYLLASHASVAFLLAFFLLLSGDSHVADFANLAAPTAGSRHAAFALGAFGVRPQSGLGSPAPLASGSAPGSAFPRILPDVGCDDHDGLVRHPAHRKPPRPAALVVGLAYSRCRGFFRSLRHPPRLWPAGSQAFPRLLVDRKHRFDGDGRGAFLPRLAPGKPCPLPPRPRSSAVPCRKPRRGQGAHVHGGGDRGASRGNPRFGPPGRFGAFHALDRGGRGAGYPGHGRSATDERVCRRIPAAPRGFGSREPPGVARRGAGGTGRGGFRRRPGRGHVPSSLCPRFSRRAAPRRPQPRGTHGRAGFPAAAPGWPRRCAFPGSALARLAPFVGGEELARRCAVAADACRRSWPRGFLAALARRLLRCFSPAGNRGRLCFAPHARLPPHRCPNVGLRVFGRKSPHAVHREFLHPADPPAFSPAFPPQRTLPAPRRPFPEKSALRLYGRRCRGGSLVPAPFGFPRVLGIFRLGPSGEVHLSVLYVALGLALLLLLIGVLT
jgi:hypothetical protein